MTLPGAEMISAAVAVAVSAPVPVAVSAPVPVAVAGPVTAAVTAVAAAVPAVARAVIVVPAQVLAGRLALHDLDRDQRQLAAVVHLADLDLDLVTDLDHRVNVVDPRAAVQLADLGDVQQPVPAREQRHERAERGRLHHRAEEPLPNLGDVRGGYRVDRRPGGLGRRSVGGADVDC